MARSDQRSAGMPAAGVVGVLLSSAAPAKPRVVEKTVPVPVRVRERRRSPLAGLASWAYGARHAHRGRRGLAR